MTDGPFRNAELSSRWKRYGCDLVSDATDAETRTAQASHSMLEDVDVKAFNALLADLKAYSQRPQMDLDPVPSIEAAFQSHPPSPRMDDFQKHLLANLREQVPLDDALNKALRSSITDWIGMTKNRIDEECIRARDRRDMSPEDYRKGIDRNREAFSAISTDALCDALRTGDKGAFKQALQKKKGLDEGPDE